VTHPRRRAGDATPRGRLRRRRLAAFVAALPVALALVGVGVLLGAPHEAGTIRLGGVALGWWATLAGFGALLLALALRPRAAR